MSNRVMRNLPPIYNGIKEMEEITESVSVELEELDTARKRVENEQFIMTSSERFIRLREKGYQIRADPSKESLDFRRKRLITRQSTRLPITQRRVHEVLNTLVGPGNYEEQLDINNCGTTFIFDATEEAVSNEIDYTLDRLIPLNIALSVIRRLKNKMYVPSYLSAGSEVTLYPMSIGNIEQNVNASMWSYVKSANEITIEPL